jgi:hypothetical protein
MGNLRLRCRLEGEAAIRQLHLTRLLVIKPDNLPYHEPAHRFPIKA